MPIRRRAGIVVTVVGLVWMILVGRLVQLQFWQQDELGDRAARQREVVEDIAPRPGDIFDRQGRLLATSVQASKSVRDPVAVVEAVERRRATRRGVADGSRGSV